MQTLDVFAVSPKEMQGLGIDRATAALFARARAPGRTSPPEELVDLTLSVLTINTWNRFAISFRETPV